MKKSIANTTRHIYKYLLITFLWTWGFWGAALLLSIINAIELDTGATLATLLAEPHSSIALVVQILFALAVFGPLIGYLQARRYRPFLGKPTRPIVAFVFLVPVVSLLPALVMSLLTITHTTELTTLVALATIGVYFLSNLLTSGTEEFGWRGYLYPALKSIEKSFWSVAWKGGLIWSIWHLPLMLILYWSHGWAMIPTLGGFVASIIAMNYITNVIYEKSNSIALTMLLHALNNTASFALVLLFPETPFVIIIAVMAWIFVGIMERRYKLN